MTAADRRTARNRSNGSKLAAMKRRLLAAYGQATADDLAQGLAWYGRAADAARAMLPAEPRRAAGVIAALSPRAQWAVNLRWAAEIIDAAERGESEPPSVHTRAMRGQAWRIANGADPLDVLNGPKVRAFFANITGDLDAVTVDVWATLAAEGPNVRRAKYIPGKGAPIIAPSGGRYALIARAYRETAAIVGIPPRDLQAAIWVNIRGRAN